MATATGIGLVCVVAVPALVLSWRRKDVRQDSAERERLLALQPEAPARFDRSMIADLPDPARRFFEYAILPGTPLRTVVEIGMAGRFGMGTKADPKYLDMKARQVLAAPDGFVWSMRAGRGMVRLSGSDSGSWTRFWIGGVVPVARLGGDPDHRRSAWGRCIAEAAFWSPAALLPRAGVRWAAVDGDTAEVTVHHDGMEQSVRVTVDAQGRAGQVAFPRWSNANEDKVYRLQPFGGFLSEHREFEGFRLPTRIVAGNFFGTEEFFPFFEVEVTDLKFPPPVEPPARSGLGQAAMATTTAPVL